MLETHKVSVLESCVLGLQMENESNTLMYTPISWGAKFTTQCKVKTPQCATSFYISTPGAGYEDSTSLPERADDAVPPGGYYKYVWDVSPSSTPTASDPDCLTYIYSSQVDIVRDFNSGLIGALLICKIGDNHFPPVWTKVDIESLVLNI